MYKNQFYLKEFLLQQKQKKGYVCVPYIVLGYPNWKVCYSIVTKLLQNGADTVELGIPFTDPTADGITIQLAFQRVLENKFQLEKVFQFVQKLRKDFPNIPFPIMGYSNFFYHQGNYKKIFSKFQENSIYDYIIPDIPWEEQENTFYNVKNMNYINFITLNTSLTRMKKIVKNSTSFIYAVSVRGITGTRKKLDMNFYKNSITVIREYTSTPILVGFGISSKEQAQKVVQYADGFVIGSYLIYLIQSGNSADGVASGLKKILP